MSGSAAQVDAAFESWRLGAFGFRDDGLREIFRNAVRVNGDQRNLTLIVWIPEAFDDLGARRREAPAAHKLEPDEISVFRVAVVAGLDRPGLELLAVDRRDRAAAPLVCAVDSKQAALLARELFDCARFVGRSGPVPGNLVQAHEHAVADADFGIVRIVADNQSHDGAQALLGVPVQWFGNQVAIAVAAGDFDCRRRRQAAFSTERAPISGERALFRHFGEAAFSAIRAPPFTANARAISRLPALPGCAFRNSMICSLLGMSPSAGARAFFRLPGARIVSGPKPWLSPAPSALPPSFSAAIFLGPTCAWRPGCRRRRSAPRQTFRL